MSLTVSTSALNIVSPSNSINKFPGNLLRQQLRGKLDKRTHPLADAWVTWCQSVERLTATAGKLDDTLAAEHEAAVKRIQAEENKLRANADFREDLLR